MVLDDDTSADGGGSDRLLTPSDANGSRDSPSHSVAMAGQGHYAAIAISWIMGCAFLFPWNALLTVEDYYYVIFSVSPLIAC